MQGSSHTAFPTEGSSWKIGGKEKTKAEEDEKLSQTYMSSWFVLIGGESLEEQGSDLSKRQFLHTSLNFIGQAYENLRMSGVPRENIIVIAQLMDYLRSPHVTEDSYPYKAIQQSCGRLIAEGGVDYDFEHVNPGTVWCVLRGIQSKQSPKVVPQNSGSIFFGIYSHGDYHPSQPVPPTAPNSNPSRSTATTRAILPPPINPYNHEWFAHMPYPIQSPDLATEMLSFVSTAGATGEKFHTPERYLYATQLRSIFVHLFTSSPHRPVIGLLNFCFSGGMVEFMKQPVARAYCGADTWPLFLMSASQSTHSALVGGLWTDFFALFSNEMKKISGSPPQSPSSDPINEINAPPARRRLRSSSSVSTSILLVSNEGSTPTTLQDFFLRVRSSYFQNCSYELHGHVISRVFAGRGNKIWSCFSVEIMSLLSSGENGEPDYLGLQELQDKYKKRGLTIWHSDQWGQHEASLVEAVQEARKFVAIPDLVFGEKSGICQMTISELLRLDDVK
jgi:hypothetical protein